MTLAPGTRIGNFEIVTPLGAGGMGEVYRARDTRLERTVAIKALPAAFAADRERLARFEREARLLASLAHPNIAGIHGIEDASGASYLVLEFIEGETLAQRIARGPLPVREAIDVGTQIASAIEAAHERGIVHRDLKPGNVMLAGSRAVKVLDFGLAKGAAPVAASGDLSASPTVAVTATGAGVILGTASYMSPEQARGRDVDRRADVWAFGCVLYECLAGRQAFGGETVSDVIARIIEREPDWSALPGSVPIRLRNLVRRCLTKDADERPRDIGDLRRELGAIAQEMSSPARVAPAVDDTPSLAVLYFENLAKDPDSEYFCSGVTEDILTDLSKIKGLRVASRNAVARYRGAPADLPKIASELGVRAVLEGTVRRAGDRVRITVQLVNAADGFQLWAERFDRTLEDVFAVQEEIASAIATALRGALTPAEAKKLAEDKPKDVRAYDLYLKGRERYNSYSRESLNEALDLFRQATEVDPKYALAWAGTADTYGQMIQWGFTKDATESARLGLEAARRAISINPRLAEAYKAEALVLRYSGDSGGEHAALIKAIEANPNYTPALLNLGVGTFCRGDLAATERLVLRSLEVDPQETFAVIWIALLMMYTGRLDETLAATDRLRRLSDDAFYITATHLIRVQVPLLRGDLAAAGEMLREALADGAWPNHVRAVEAEIAVRSGRADEARRIIQELENASGLGGGALTSAAVAAIELGDTECAVRFMRQRIVVDMAPVVVRLDPGLHALADHESFAPRRLDATLVWPLEAPMIPPAVHALFRDVRIESGRPKGSDLRLR